MSTLLPIPTNNFYNITTDNSNYITRSDTSTCAPITTINNIDHKNNIANITVNLNDILFEPINIKFSYTNEQKIKNGTSHKLPDGSLLVINDDGNFKIQDKNNKITYKACHIREFNRYINASDLLEDFILYLGKQGIKQKDVLNIPIELFITWLIYQASVQDKIETKEEVFALEDKTKKLKIIHRCKNCGKFLSDKFRKLGINFCNSNHMNKYMIKLGI